MAKAAGAASGDLRPPPSLSSPEAVGHVVTTSAAAVVKNGFIQSQQQAVAELRILGWKQLVVRGHVGFHPSSDVFALQSARHQVLENRRNNINFIGKISGNIAMILEIVVLFANDIVPNSLIAQPLTAAGGDRCPGDNYGDEVLYLGIRAPVCLQRYVSEQIARAAAVRDAADRSIRVLQRRFDLLSLFGAKNASLRIDYLSALKAKPVRVVISPVDPCPF
ncbi:hypothetical protein [Bradyrhizobium sp. 162]|uniref:hypothetical protein n=1 Tax=Bradyrhizobium sp. 162 TaxID=2782635 RepID=UPI001FF8CCAC|nr:hypothetical protein [Bradyrhizobium sp. 162]MCK1629545.1 hypothetical protein [Bradyrhizobium sp. 162]